MNKEKTIIEKIVLMYHKAQYGYAKDVQEAQSDFSEYMSKLYKEIKERTK